MIAIADLILEAERLGVRVEWCDALEAPAAYVHDLRAIFLRDGRSDIATRCSLAHEIGHAYYGHESHGHYPAQERAANRYAAGLLIAAEDYARAERIVGHHPSTLARELEVTPAMVEAWREARAA